MVLKLMIAVAWFACGLLTAQSSSDAIQRLVRQGDRALAEARYPEAEQAFEQVRKLAPWVAEVHAKLGLIYFQEGKFSKAVPALNEALKLKPGLPNADGLLAMSLSELGRFKEALPGLERTFRKPADPALKRMTGLQLQRAYTGLRRDSEAVEVALELARLYPDDPEVLYHSARLFGNYAFLSMRKLSQVAPGSVWRKLAAGEVHESQEAYGAAINDYREALAADPRHPGVHFRIGRALLARARGNESRAELTGAALNEFEQELEIDPTNANAAYESGEIQRQAGQFEAARRFFEQSVRAYPDFEDARIGLGRTLIELKQPMEALPHLRKAVALNPENEVAYFTLAQAHRALDNRVEQRKALLEFRRLRDMHASAEPTQSRREITKQELDPGSRAQP